MHALSVNKLGCFLSKPFFNSTVPSRRFLRFFGTPASTAGTHYRKISPDEALLLRRLSHGRPRDAHQMLADIFQRDRHKGVKYWTSILTKYARSGFVDEARVLFEAMPEKNVVTYNAMLSGYVKCGRMSGAWSLFREMPEKNVVSWTMMLSALSEEGKVEDAVKMFDEMPERNIVSWNTLVTCLIRNGDLEKARRVFNAMPSRDIVSWNAMISGYVENDMMEEARVLFEKMEDRNVITWTSMVDGYCRIGNVLEGYRLFREMPARNVVSWTAMIGGFARNEFYREALLLVLEMKKDLAVKPNGETLVSIAYACAGLGFEFHRLGKQLHAQVLASGWDNMDQEGRLGKSLVHMYASFGLMGLARSLFNRNSADCDLQTCNMMINGYLRIGSLEEAEILFEEVKSFGDRVSWTSMIEGYFEAGDLQKAFDLFREIPNKDGITWTVMISGLVRNELLLEAASLFSEMFNHGLEPLNSTYSVLLGAAGAMANLDQGKHLHCMIIKTKYYDTDLILQNSLVSMYAKCGAIEEAYGVFSRMVHRDTVSWNSMIMAFSHHGRAEEALQLFKQMLDSGTNPNSITFLSILSACSHSGLVTRGFELFNAMKNTYSIQPGIEHYVSMVDLLGRAGKPREAEEFISTLPFTPDKTIYGALLGTCRIAGKDTRTAERAAEKLLELDPGNGPGHVALCNVYAWSGRHEEEREVRKEMGLKGVKKSPGCSWVVVNGKGHVFLSGDKVTCEVVHTTLSLLCGLPEGQEQEDWSVSDIES
ncbi:PREDICTED: pentatricopeptide repeat-containing protein At1g32415, mitochondrial [Tarenaya hassleriana]|uniref:pentatricopeptide repeat-containing protein At1g32415, mitochondrial n=1 Tax=Tarenaya hassleriana TaxID=28532 RepID=UPI00053C4212|nr:PREDICTED: pentatricopeptide repeat-containing protein At1g32415, mitochondrial [Tarenaya hassleriana]